MAVNPVLLAADVLLRRVGLPATLLASVVIRYNIFSLMNLLLFLFSILLPGTRLKAKKSSCVVYLVVVVVWSFVAAVSQCLFQAAYKPDELLPCSQLESNWRQFGLILYEGIDAVDVVRHLVPDCAIFLIATFNMVTTIIIIVKMRNKNSGGDADQSLREEGERDLNSDWSSHTDTVPSLPSHVQCYRQLPKSVGIFLEVCIFIALGLSGIAVPSLASFVYYSIFLLILCSWSCHLLSKFAGILRVLRSLLTFYVMAHLVVLYLYQFQAAQDNIPLQPDNTTKSLLARLFGLTPVISTDCQNPTRLLLHPGVEVSVFINPCVLLVLSLLLSIELRLWINTPVGLWKATGAYHYPVSDSRPSSHLHMVSSQQSGQTEWSKYGTYRLRGAHGQACVSGGGSGEDLTNETFQESGSEESESGSRRGGGEEETSHLSPEHIGNKIKMYAISLWSVLLTISYIPAIVCMMLWSVLYPSWPALVLLLWACTIWLIPKFTPKDSLFYTSPALVFYAVCLLLLQYVFSLNLTLDELQPQDGLGQECYRSTLPACESIVPLMKTLFTITFFLAFHEFVRIKTPLLSQHHPDGEMPLISIRAEENQAEDSAPYTMEELGSKFYKSLLDIISRYWIVVVVAAFLLVCLSGEPNILKTVYLVFFFIFLITYQVFRNCWYYICIPIWWCLVLYAALELTLIYTYQFSSVRTAWEKAQNSTPALHVNAEDLFNSIGLIKYGINSFQGLFVSLIPPAVFIAVMAIQLRYFNPLSDRSSTPLNQDNTDDPNTQDDEDIEESPAADSSQKPIISQKYVKMTKVIYSVMSQIIWRALEIHLHKLSMVVMFVVVLSEISAGYWLLLLILLVIIPLPYFNSLLYPLLTAYMGILSVLKTVYQFPIIESNDFNFTKSARVDDPGECSETLNTTSYIGNYSGIVYHYRYSSRVDDGGWLGFHKVSNYPLYIIGLLGVSLLLSLYFSIKRRQASYYKNMNINILSWERKSIFLNVSKRRAENSLLAAFKYLVNHLFEMYGIEITFIMMVITIAVRIDVYGVLYCILLGLFLLTPRGLMAPLWLLYIVIYGVSLLVQYFMLLGVPPGACFYPGSDRVYPWDTIVHSEISNFGMKKWLFLPDYPQLLNRNLLYVDYVVYILLSLQMYNFKKVAEFHSNVSDFLGVESIINFLKVILTRYFIWVSIFLIFVAAISRVSFFGFFYLIVCFTLLYRGENMLLDTKRKRIMSWTSLRLIALLILLVKILVQIADCVFYEDLKGAKCYLIIAVNGGCNSRAYYGSPTPECDSPNNIGLWVDVLTFTVITIQIAIFDTRFSEMMRNYLADNSVRGAKFSVVLDGKIAERQEREKAEREEEFLKLRERIQELSVSENTVDHILHAGVRIPPGMTVAQRAPRIFKSEVDDALTDDEGGEQPKSKPSDDCSESESKFSRIKNFVFGIVYTTFDKITEWLEWSSSLYVEVVTELKVKEKAVDLESKCESSSGRDTTPPSGATDVHREGSNEVVDVEISEVERGNQGKNEDEDYLEKELEEVAEKYSKRPMRLLYALRNALIAHAEFVIYFLIILNVILNGSILSLGFAILLFFWGLFCIPWPTKTFWLTLIFYSMMVLVVKYAFQFHSIDALDPNEDTETGLSTSSVLGIEYHNSSLQFFRNAVWDMLLLIALLINRGILKQNGLWRSYGTPHIMSFFQRVKGDTKQFYLRLLSADINRGAADYYVIMLFLDALCMITIVLGISSFGVGIAGAGVDQIAGFVENNNIPLPFVLTLLLQFLFMIIDRAIYLRRAIKAKFAFQIFLLVVWNMWLLFILPSNEVTRRPFTSNTAAQFLYFFKSLYFIISAMQIVSGYPTNISGYFLGRHYNTVSGILFQAYRAIPILPELREVIDWVFTDTVLSLLHWLRVQEIYAKLYLVKIRRQREQGSPRDLGDKQGLVIKALMGGFLLVFLVLLIWGPLLLISFIISTSTIPNTPVSASVQLSINGYEPLVQISIQNTSIHVLEPNEYQQLIDSLSSEVRPRFGSQLFRADFVKAEFPNESTSLWTISPPAKQLLMNDLESVRSNQSTAAIQFSWEIQRASEVTSVSESVVGAQAKVLNYKDYPSVIDDLISALSGEGTDVLLPPLYPRLIRAPATGLSKNDSSLSVFFNEDNITCSTSLSNTTTSTQEWWTLNHCRNPLDPTDFGPAILLIYSERLTPQIFGFIAGLGIYGLYVTVVLFIGKFIRSYVSSLPSQLLLDEIVYPDPLIKLCHDIFLVRQSKDFKLEEILVGKLFSIFRSAEKLLDITESPKKDKLD